MRRYLTPALIVTAALSQPLTAFADENNCPPGAWFCEAPAPSVDVDVDADVAIRPPPAADTLPVPEEEEEPPPVVHHRGRGSPPPVVVYRPGASASPRPQIIIIAPGGTRVVRKASPPPVRRVYRRSACTLGSCAPVRPALRWKSEWGLNLRLQGVSFGGDDHGHEGGQQTASRDAGMGGFGMSLRYRPTPRFAFDAGFDVLGGTDFNGFERVEMPFSVSGIFYLNPRSRSQFYVTGGVNWSSATVTSDQAHPLLLANKSNDGFSADYKYFGGQLGVGLEFRLSKRVAFNVDVLGFVRSRTDIDDDDDGRHGKDQDKDQDKLPEFMDADTGRSTNTSGGGLFRGGLTFWW